MQVDHPLYDATSWAISTIGDVDKHTVIVIGTAQERDALYAAWAAGQDPWFVRRDVERIDTESALDIDADILAGSTVLGTAAAKEATVLDDDPWIAKQQAFDMWPDRAVRLRQLRLHHLHRGWPVELLPKSADTPARVLGYLLRVRS